MSIGLVGQKCGMTRIFDDNGVSVPVTVIKVEANRIVQIKNKAIDGYNSIQVTTGLKRVGSINKPMLGHFASANVEAGRGLWEFRISDQELNQFKVGESVSMGIFTEGQVVDVRSKTICKVFAGGIKRHHFHMQDATHGNSRSHRVLGSIGMCQTPGRVFKGKKMEGHLGNANRTIQNLVIKSIDQDKNIILVKGSVPGSKGSDVVITPAVKKKLKASK